MKNYKCQMQKLTEFFSKKKSWSQMIQNCLIRREMAKKNSAADGGFRRQLRDRRRFSVFRVATFNSKNFKKKLDH